MYREAGASIRGFTVIKLYFIFHQVPTCAATITIMTFSLGFSQFQATRELRILAYTLEYQKSDKADKMYFSTTRNLHKVKYVFTQLELNSLV